MTRRARVRNFSNMQRRPLVFRRKHAMPSMAARAARGHQQSRLGQTLAMHALEVRSVTLRMAFAAILDLMVEEHAGVGIAVRNQLVMLAAVALFTRQRDRLAFLVFSRLRVRASGKFFRLRLVTVHAPRSHFV